MVRNPSGSWSFVASSPFVTRSLHFRLHRRLARSRRNASSIPGNLMRVCSWVNSYLRTVSFLGFSVSVAKRPTVYRRVSRSLRLRPVLNGEPRRQSVPGNLLKRPRRWTLSKVIRTPSRIA